MTCKIPDIHSKSLFQHHRKCLKFVSNSYQVLLNLVSRCRLHQITTKDTDLIREFKGIMGIFKGNYAKPTLLKHLDSMVKLVLELTSCSQICSVVIMAAAASQDSLSICCL